MISINRLFSRQLNDVFAMKTLRIKILTKCYIKNTIHTGRIGVGVVGVVVALVNIVVVLVGVVEAVAVPADVVVVPSPGVVLACVVLADIF